MDLEKEAELQDGMDEFLTRIKDTTIVPEGEGVLDVIELERSLDNVFKENGKESLKENNGKIFMTLSGGLDSSLCLAFLRKNFPEDEIVTFTIGGSEKHPDVVAARIVAKKYQTKHNEYIPTPKEIGDAMIEYGDKYSFSEDFKKASETGDFDTYLLYKYISKFSPKVILAHDGIDELLGGYPQHRWNAGPEEKKQNFIKYWEELIPGHIEPLNKTTKHFNIDVLYPYLDKKIIDITSRIPLDLRTTKEESKIPLREIARKLNIPNEIIERKKEGRVGALAHFNQM